MQIFILHLLNEHEGYLDAEEAKHCVQVLRHQEGDQIHTIDGKGNYYLSQIESAHKDRVHLRLLDHQAQWGEKACYIRLGISPLRLKDRFEWLVEKAVELGVNEIIPIRCQHTQKFTKYSVSRMEKRIQSALKQCKRSLLPIFQPEISIETFLQETESSLGFIAQGNSPTSLPTHTSDIQKASDLLLLIGPEGDFSESEVELAIQKGVIPVHLGHNRLRSETAGIYAISVVKMIQGY